MANAAPPPRQFGLQRTRLRAVERAQVVHAIARGLRLDLREPADRKADDTGADDDRVDPVHQGVEDRAATRSMWSANLAMKPARNARVLSSAIEKSSAIRPALVWK